MRVEDINSIESESGIIASLIHNPSLSFYSENLYPNHFTDKQNRIIYTAICELARRGIMKVDPYNILECLNASEATRKLADELTIESLNEFVDMSEIIARNTVEEYKMLVSNVLDTAFRRDTYQVLKECQTLCLDMSHGDIQKKVYDSIDHVMSDYTDVDDVTLFGDVVDELWDEVEAHQDGKEAGIPFKIPILNEYVTLERGELVVIGAPPKGAKSMFMLNEAVDILRQGKSVVYIDSELSDRLFLCRMIAHLSGVEFRKVRSGRYTPEEASMIYEARSWIKNQRFIHKYMPTFNKQAIYTLTKKACHKFDGLDVLVVDYFKSTDGGTDAYAVYSELGSLTDMVKNELCGRMEIAGLAAAQMARNGGLADSAKIARNASTIMYLTDKTQDEIEADGDECGNKKLFVAMNRNGMQHVEGEYIDLDFKGNVCLLTEASKQHIPSEPF